MELHMNPRLKTVQKSGIRIFTQMAKQEEGCLFLTLGEPDLDTPSIIRDTAKESLDAGETHYPENNGQAFLRQAIADFEATRHGLFYSPDEVIVTVGATEALFISLFGILEPGDEVIIPMPAFGLYDSIVRMLGAVTVPIDTRETAFQLTENQLQAALSPRTKAVILTSPNNPTGCIYRQETLETIHRLLKDLPIFVLCDEVYRDLIYTEEYSSFTQFADMRDRIIEVQSFSKPYAMTGWRVGYLLADAPVKQQLEKVHQYDVVSVASFVQKACAEALHYDIREHVALYRRRRDFVCKKLKEMGLPFVLPEGAFYIFPRIDQFGLDSNTFCTRMVKEAKLACTPGICFGAEGYLRISYCYDDTTLAEGMNRLASFIQTL